MLYILAQDTSKTPFYPEFKYSHFQESYLNTNCFYASLNFSLVQILQYKDFYQWYIYYVINALPLCILVIELFIITSQY